MFLVVSAAPTAAQELAAVTGSAQCTQPGTYTITWAVENSAGANGEVVLAVISGSTYGDILDSFSPNPFQAADGLIVGSNQLRGDYWGLLVLDITIVFDVKGTFEFNGEAEVFVDGSCVAMSAPTEPSPTSTLYLAPSVEARPSFTG